MVTLTFNGSSMPVTKESLRTLRAEWMYNDSDFLWLTDEVIYLTSSTRPLIVLLCAFYRLLMVMLI